MVWKCSERQESSKASWMTYQLRQRKLSETSSRKSTTLTSTSYMDTQLTWELSTPCQTPRTHATPTRLICSWEGRRSPLVLRESTTQSYSPSRHWRRESKWRPSRTTLMRSNLERQTTEEQDLDSKELWNSSATCTTSARHPCSQETLRDCHHEAS